MLRRHLRRIRPGLIALAAMMALGTQSAAAQEIDLDNQILFGVNGSNGHLVRYDFAGSAMTDIGVIESASGTVFSGIKGMAYNPRYVNIFGFWVDPADSYTKLLYINTDTAEAAVVGDPLGVGEVTAATTAMMDTDADGNLILGTDGDADKGHGNDCDGVDEDNPGSSTGVSESGMGHGAHSGCGTVLGISDKTPIGDINKTKVFAIQTVEAVEEAPIEFTIDAGRVIPQGQFAAKVSVLGAAITYGSGGYDLAVTVRATVGGTAHTPFGDYNGGASGNVNDGNNPRHFILPSIYAANTAISLEGRSWVKSRSNYSGSNDNHWQSHMAVDSADDSPQVVILRNGDDAPNITAFSNQNSIVDFIRDYVDPVTNKIKLDENQAICLYELGTTNLSGSDADFQDLVVLVTLAADRASLEESDDDNADAAPAARLIQVNTQTGAAQQIMTLTRIYDGLAASPTSRFYATLGNQLYMLDPIDQVETLMGTLPSAEMKGLEFAGPTMFGFAHVGDRLYPIDVTGAAMGSSFSVGAANLQSIIFMRRPDQPAVTVSYD